METMNQRRVPAGAVPKPETVAPNSVFAAGQAAKPKRNYEPFDPDKIEIKRGVPLPAASTLGARASGSLALLGRMKSGDMVELPDRKAHTIASAAKKAGIKVALRRLGDGVKGVWKL